MGSSLRDIPGAGGGKRRGGLGKVAPGPGGKPWQPPPRTPSGRSTTGRVPRVDRIRFQGPRWEVDRFNLALGAAFLGLFVFGAVWILRANDVSVSSTGLEDGGGVTTDGVAALEVGIVIDPAGQLEAASVEFQGEDASAEVTTEDDRLVWVPPGELEEGTYELSVSVPRPVFGSVDWSLTFTVDDTPPVLDAPSPEGVGLGEPVTIRGRVDEPVELTAEGESVEVDDDGAFEVTFATAPAGAVDLVATDPAGNVTELAVPVAVEPPASRGVHLGSSGWADEAAREAALGLLDAGQVDTIVVDVKDECGVVTYATDVELAGQVGAVEERFDLEDAIATVHDRGGQLVARVVTFRDPLLTRWAWANAHPDWVLQDTANDPWPVYGDGEGCPEATNAAPIIGGFANFASPEVQAYNLAVASEVAALGADQVLLDDVRRPDGDTTFLQAPGMTGTVVETLTGFLAIAREQVRAESAYLGATASGLSVRDPGLYDQDLAAFAPDVDYLAPEVYPESYSAGFFNLPEPVAAPGLAVEAALNEAKAQLGDLTTPLVAWLQDYSSGIPYGLTEVQAQVDGAAGAGSCSWVLRDPELTYTPGVRAAC